MNTDKILLKALNLEPVSVEEGIFIYENVSTTELMLVAHECRQKQVPGNKVGWIIDRNVNITNVCISGCKFCNFHCKINEEAQYITTIDEYCKKTEELCRGWTTAFTTGQHAPETRPCFLHRSFQ